MKNTERFSDRVENYVRFRPHYPEALLDFLIEEMGLNKSMAVADIGSGTGLLSELFMQFSDKIFGVEPNAAMRQAAEELYKDVKSFTSINGSAENTNLNDASVDLIIAGQAFHWFDRAKAQAEFKRIARPNGWTALVWNERKQSSPFQKAYEEMLLEYAPGYKESTHRNIRLSDIESFFAPQKCMLKSFDNVQMLNFMGLKGRLLSSSYAPLQKSPQYLPMMFKLQEIFGKYSSNGLIAFDYDCNLYYGRI
jgi:ubiquinone/menaquinone biosynthesis C-methylase UbiE